MVKTRAIKKMGQDLYQQAEMNFHGDIKSLVSRGKTFLDTINPKTAEAKMKFENPMCGKIGLATTDSLRLVANTCEDCSKPAIKGLKDSSEVIVKDLPSSVSPSGQGIVEAKTYSRDTIKVAQPQTSKYVVKKGDTFWDLASKALGPKAKNHDVSVLKNEILALNNMTEQQAKHLKINSVVKMPAAFAQSQNAVK